MITPRLVVQTSCTTLLAFVEEKSDSEKMPSKMEEELKSMQEGKNFLSSIAVDLETQLQGFMS